MWKKIQERTLPFIIALTALAVSASAAFYSVSGLSKLFAGASLEVTIMASSLEVAKLVIASLLYQYRKTIPTVLKYYLTTAAFVLVMITSMGIYGFLSAAYQETASKAGNIDAQVELLEVKKSGYEEQLSGFMTERSDLNQSISDLRAGLAGNTIQYKDKETGQILTTTSSSNRRAFERQLDQALARQEVINGKIDDLNESIFELETEIVDVRIGSDIAGELGPLKYLSGLTGIPMDQIINYLLLVIIFVFDPLAIALVIAANYAFERLKPVENIYGEKEVIEDDGMWSEKEMKDFNNQFNADDLLPDEEENDWEDVDEEQEFDEYDLNRDGIVDENEKLFQEESKRIYNIGGLSTWRKNKMVKDLKEKLFGKE